MRIDGDRGVRTVLGLDARFYGGAESALAVAAILGSIAAELLTGRLKSGRLSYVLAAIGVCIIPAGVVFLLPSGVMTRYAVIAAAFCGMQAAISIFSIFAVSMIQQNTPGFQGSVYLVLIPSGIVVCVIGLLAAGFFRKLEKSRVAQRTDKRYNGIGLWTLAGHGSKRPALRIGLGEFVMENRKRINDKLVSWIINKVKTEYADDICLVLIYGSYVNGTANRKSDIDCYYIPNTERGYDLAVDFMIDGVGYDIFPMSWERVAGIADLQEVLLPLVGDAQIIYCRDAGDLQRFRDLQGRLKSNLLNEKYVRDIAAEKCGEANRMCSLMKQSHGACEIRKLAGGIIMTLADAVAIYNNDYYHFGLKKQFEDLQNRFPDIPPEIADDYKCVVEAVEIEDVIKCTLKMLKDVCGYVGAACADQAIPETENLKENKVNASRLAGLYEEISSTFNKVYVCCEEGNYILAFLSAVCLQWDLDDAGEAGCPKYDLLGDLNYKELHGLSAKAQKIENDLVDLIVQNGGRIKRYDSFEQFEMDRL